jgi:cell division protease FtsH
LSEATTAVVDASVRRILEAARARALAILKENLAILMESASQLLAHETLSGDELEKIRAKLGKSPGETRKGADARPHLVKNSA